MELYNHADTRGDLSESHAICREAGRQEERQRVLVEIVLALDKGGQVSWVRDALLALKEHVDNPRSKEELDAALLESIKKVAIPYDQV
jgi:predicted transcriptional regulator